MGTLFRERAVASRAATEVTDRPVRVVNAPVWAALGLALILLTTLGVWLLAGTVALTTRARSTGSGLTELTVPSSSPWSVTATPSTLNVTFDPTPMSWVGAVGMNR